MTTSVRILLPLLLTLCCSIFSAGAADWQKLYLTKWYPTDPAELKQAKAYIDQHAKAYINKHAKASIKQQSPLKSLNKVQRLTSTEQLKLAQATLFYLRDRRLKKFNSNFKKLALLTLELSKLLNRPLMAAESNLHLASYSINQRASEADTFNYINSAAKQLKQPSAEEANPKIFSILSTQLLERKASHLLNSSHLKEVTASQALQLLNEAILKDQHLEPTLTGHLFYLQAGCYNRLQKPEMALGSLYKALRLINKEQSSWLLADIHRTMGEAYFKQRQYEVALDYLSKAAELFHQQQEVSRYNLTLQHIGNLFIAQGKYNEALAVLLQTHEANKKQHPYSSARKNLLIAKTYLLEQNPQKALIYANEILNKLSALPEGDLYPISVEAHTQKLQAQVILKQVELAQAIEQAESLRQEASKREYPELVRLINQVLIPFYQQEKSYEKANDLLLLSLSEIRNRLFSAEQHRTEQIEESHQHNLMQKKIEQSQQKLELLQRNISLYRNYAVWSLVTLLIAISALFSRFRKIAQLNNKIAQIKRQSLQSPVTGLGNERRLYSAIKQHMGELQQEQKNWYYSKSTIDPPSGKMFMLLRIPSLQTIYEVEGMDTGRCIELKLGHFLRQKFGDESVFQAKDDLFGIILPGLPPHICANKVFKTLDDISQTGVGSLEQMSLAMLQYPFAGKASQSSDLKVVEELLILATMAAAQLTVRHSTHAWVALESIDSIPLTLFRGHIRDNLLLAIDKGFIKVLTEFDKSKIVWPDAKGPYSSGAPQSEKVLAGKVD